MSTHQSVEARPRVLIDCTAVPHNLGGVGRYVHGLIGGFDSRDVDLVLVTQARDRDAFAHAVPWAEVRAVSPIVAIGRPLRIAWEQLGLPGLARRLGVHVVHSPHYTYPRSWRGGRVVTVHDATFYSDPLVHTIVKRGFFRRWIRAAWNTSHVVVTPSAATEGEVERFLGAAGGFVQVAYLGVDSAHFHPPTTDQVEAFRETHGLGPDERWFAFLGTIEPRKNLLAVLDAYIELRKELGAKSPRLLVSGGRGWDDKAIARLDSLGPDSGVLELGYLPVSSLPSLLGGAVAVVYPSFGEGFGLPVLEAMACGAAVLTSNRLAIPEVGGNAVIYVDVTSESIRDALRDAATDGEAAQNVRALAQARAGQFTWKSAADAHLAAYRHAARDTRGQADGVA